MNDLGWSALGAILAGLNLAMAFTPKDTIGHFWLFIHGCLFVLMTEIAVRSHIQHWKKQKEASKPHE